MKSREPSSKEIRSQTRLYANANAHRPTLRFDLKVTSCATRGCFKIGFKFLVSLDIDMRYV